ncbi:MAG: hypothetical protein KKA73_00890 [Chloroflexi bacterium]|nr:hypothetical protein [Chloroflexota bacterium]MBU1746219.1 hypothetical protein [Chloroflexota bacterium]
MAEPDPERGRELLAWQVRPLTSAPRQLALLLVVMLAMLPILYAALGHLMGAVLLWGAVWLSLVPAWLPTRYVLYEHGVLVRQVWRSRFRPWSAFARCAADDAGVLLSPFDAPRRLDATRGVYLRAAGNKESILQIVQAQLHMEIPGEMWYTREAVAPAQGNDRP